jgi:hypothetical protein
MQSRDWDVSTKTQKCKCFINILLYMALQRGDLVLKCEQIKWFTKLKGEIKPYHVSLSLVSFIYHYGIVVEHIYSTTSQNVSKMINMAQLINTKSKYQRLDLINKKSE